MLTVDQNLTIPMTVLTIIMALPTITIAPSIEVSAPSIDFQTKPLTYRCGKIASTVLIDCPCPLFSC